MDQLVLLFVLALGALVTVPLADRLKLPAPVLMTLLGIALAILPFIPNVTIAPEIILPLALPPLLYAAVRRTSWRQFTTNWKPIFLLAVALVFVTTAAVAALAHALVPGLPIAAAIALAALVAPPDPVATSAVAGQLGLPRRLISILEGEGLFNDVTAIVLYHVAIAAAITGTFSWPVAIGEFALSAVVAVAVGMAIGWAATKLLPILSDVTLRVGLTLLVPFVSYTLSEELHGSGVLAVLTTAFLLAETSTDADDIDGRLAGNTFWDIIDTLVTGMAFGLIGLELHNIFGTSTGQQGQLLSWGAAVSATVILVRLLWLLPASWLARKTRRHIDPDADLPATWRETIVVWWSGMRGVATVALALAVPLHTDDGQPFPARPYIIFIAFTVVMTTLVLQGLSLPWLVRTLGVKADSAAERMLEKDLALRATTAARNRLKDIDRAEDLPEDVMNTLSRRLVDIEARICPELVDEQRREQDADRAEQAKTFRRVQTDIMSAARYAVLSARTEPGADPEVVDRVLHQLDIRSQR